VTRVVACVYCGTRMPDRYMLDAIPDGDWKCESLGRCLVRRLIRNGSTPAAARVAAESGTYPDRALRPIGEP
jgi:hypothetical protein